MPEFDYDAHTTGMLNRYLDSLDETDEDEDYEPDPDRFRDEDPNDREE